MPELNILSEMENHAKDYLNNWYDEDYVYGKYALSNDFIRLPKDIDTQPLKVLGLILSKIDFKKDNIDLNGNVIVSCTLAEVMNACGQNNSEYKNYEYYKNVIEKLIKSSYVKGEIAGKDVMGYAVPWVSADKSATQITFQFKIFNDFLPYFQMLSRNYTIIELEQAKRFKSRFSYTLYMNLLSWVNNDDLNESYRFYTTKQLKEMFGLSKEDYCKKDGKFNRTEFEKKTIEVAIKEINQNTRMKVGYKKNKIKNRVANYQFNFIEVL